MPERETSRTGLLYGAVDIVYNKRQDSHCVTHKISQNTAPSSPSREGNMGFYKEISLRLLICQTYIPFPPAVNPLLKQTALGYLRNGTWDLVFVCH